MSKKKGGDKDQVPEIESNPWKLAGIGDVAALKGLVEREKDPVDVNAEDDYGCQPIIWAARSGYVDAVTYLVEQGGDIESSGFGGMRPLHHACNQLRDEVMLKLLDLNANVNAADDSGNTALHFAAERAENTAKCTPLHKAANDGHLSIVQKLINKGADINHQDGKGNSVLHIACMNRFQLMAEWLIANGANVKLKNKSSKLPSALCGPALASALFPSETKEEE
ncbi:Ankyrin repeat domain-containing protein 1 [Hondaea fermentalgiana]|uniref:Ankyrin repeat domain-containing protein 1 n=1 Tax=Hondaea fermentalgiana TaxID=2315210 RepID=A0A2R5GNV3_9STRA|nr:Ankyrin repeat domain-containing protein 1 [Hondaea fermentalgiana]|eukprot:GBG32572.1 Ankyrin repeat domain-containing protein 1 [Hondaea fermentalgiana]